MDEIINKMNEKKNSLPVQIIKYNKLMGKRVGASIAVVEGAEDSIFYSTIFHRMEVKKPDIFFPAEGKDNVLGLRDMILKSKDMPRGGGVIFFIDHDFDGLKGNTPGSDLYVTPTYSIENILVCRSAFRCILEAEFKLSDADSIDDIDRLLNMFDKLLHEHEIILEEANQLIHFARNEALLGKKITKGSINDQCSKFADYDHTTLTVKKNATGDNLIKLIGIDVTIEKSSLRNFESDFKSLDPHKNWRGKFIYFLFEKFLKLMIEDRNSSAPMIFSKGKGKISLAVGSDGFVRLMSSMCEIPICLRSFVDSYPSGCLTTSP